MASQPGSARSLVLSYLALRGLIGVIGMSLPIVLVLGKIYVFHSPGIQSSVSAYYYTGMRDVFVGSLCAIGIFLMSYRGYQWKEQTLAKVASVCAIGVALFPTSPDSNPTAHQTDVGHVHLACATLLFVILAAFSFLFMSTDPTRPMTPRKRQRNRVYLACGCAIVFSILGVSVLALLPHDLPIKQLDPVFYLEFLALFAFGVSWFTKGECILGDQ